MYEKLYDILKNDSKQLKEIFFKQSFDKESLIIHCVDKSTIRTFHAKKGYVKTYQPLSIFRFWAFDFLSDENINKLKIKNDFMGFRNMALESLKKYWKDEDGGTPQFYQFNKLIDLLFKFLPCWNELDIEIKEWVFQNANVPLDKFSLDCLRQWNNEQKIPINTSMSFVTEDNYDSLQKNIKDICKDLPVMIFELYAWENGHFKKKDDPKQNPFKPMRLLKK